MSTKSVFYCLFKINLQKELTSSISREKIFDNMKQTSHKWNFFRAGGSNQAVICSGEDIENIDKLDAKLWAALSCPTSGLTLDSKTLEIIDTNDDGRIRREEIIAACQWACANLKSPDTLLKSSESLCLDDIDDSLPEGKKLLASAREVLANLGKPNSTTISVSDFSDESKIFASTPFNADGIITALSCGSDSALVDVFNTVLSVSDVKKDRSGLDGIGISDVDAFFDDAKKFIEWNAQPSLDSSIMCLGENTESAFVALSALEVQINDWFARSKLVSYDSDMQSEMYSLAGEKLVKAYAELNFDLLRSLPIVKINSTGIIDFSKGVNPVWASECEDFAKLVDSSPFDYAKWLEILARFSPYRAWISSKPNVRVSAIALEKLKSVATDENKQKFVDLLTRDAELKDKVDSIAAVEKLVRLNRDLYKLLRNFVSFQDFYTKGQASIFQYGKLYIDGRMCELCVKVDDVSTHSKMSPLGYGYLVYCLCRKKGSPDMNVAVMITAGDCDNIIVGRNGIFYDYKGNEWDATITKVVDNPIGISQAFFSPYKRVVKWIGELVSKRASEADKSAVSSITDGNILQKNKDGKMDVGTVAAIGVAIGGITTMFGMVVNAVFGLGYWLPVGIIGVLLAISLPSVFISWLKLRMRNLAPILDGNGWAVNAKAALSMAFGSHLTRMARLPKDAKISSLRSFEKSNKGRNVTLILLFVLFAGLIGAVVWSQKKEDSKNNSQPIATAQPAKAGASKAPEDTTSKAPVPISVKK